VRRSENQRRSSRATGPASRQRLDLRLLRWRHQPALPKQFIDVEAVVAKHQFANRADMLSALVSVNEFIHGSSRESSDAQKQILLIGDALAEPVFLAAHAKEITEAGGACLGRSGPAQVREAGAEY
jgi:hypothetical protein